MASDDARNSDTKRPAPTEAPRGAGLPTALPAPAEKTPHSDPAIAPHVSGSLAAETLQANLSAIASAQTGSLEAVGSAVGFANVSGDATLTASASPIVYAKGNISIRQSYTSAVLAGGDMEINQAGAPLIIGKQLNVQQGGALVMLTGESTVTNGFVGVLLSPKTTISEESRVLIGTKAALIIAAALLDGFSLVALVMVLGVRRVMAWRPHINVPQLHRVAEIQERLHRLRSEHRS